MVALICHAFFIIFLFFPQSDGKDTQNCNGTCNCSTQAPEVLAAWCRLSNLSELSKFIKQPQDVKVLHLEITNPEGWQKVLEVKMSSLRVLFLTGNITWDIPEEILQLPMLREIRTAGIRKECSTCTLVKDFGMTDDSISVTYLPEQGYRLRNVCVQQELTLHGKYRRFSKNRFFPQCIMVNESCRIEFGTFDARNRCLDFGSPILLASALIAVLAIIANILVLFVLSVTKCLRKKPAMMLAGSLAIGDIILSMYTISIGTTYQLITPENFQNQLDEVCPYLIFLPVAGFTFSSHISFLMTLEKYLLIVHGLKPHLHMHTKPTMRCILLAGAAALGPAMLMVLSPEMFKGKQTCLPMFERETLKSTVFGWVSMSFYTVLYLSTFVLYLTIFRVARKSGNRMGIHRERQLVKRIGVIVGTNFILGFAPLLFIFIANPFVSQGVIDYDVWIVFGLSLPIGLFTLNGMIDPFLYVFRNPQFKTVLKHKWDQIKPNNTKKRLNKDCENPDEAVVITNFRKIST